MTQAIAEPTQRFFEDVEVGTQIPPREYGPHDLVTAVFWAGVQENPGLLHLDRDHARQFRRAPSIVASGALRQSFMTRVMTDWAGPRGFLSAMEIRHTTSTYEGDMQRYGGTVAEKSDDPAKPWIVIDIDGRNQNGEQIIAGRCTMLLPPRAWPVDRPLGDAR
jgi:acyl dehydratase